MKKIISIIAFLALFGAIGCTTVVEDSNDDSSSEVNSITEEAANAETDALNISFELANDWTESIDEGGNQYLYTYEPEYENITFIIHDSLSEWTTRMNDLKSGNDTLVSEETIELDGHDTTLMTFDRMGEFQYSEYFVDGGSWWLEINVSDITRSDVQEMLDSLSF